MWGSERQIRQATQEEVERWRASPSRARQQGEADEDDDDWLAFLVEVPADSSSGPSDADLPQSPDCDRPRHFLNWAAAGVLRWGGMDPSVDWEAKQIARNQQLLAKAAMVRALIRAAIVRAEAAVLNAKQTRIRLKLTRQPPPDLPSR